MGILHSHKKERDCAICDHMDGLRGCYATNGLFVSMDLPILDIAYIWNHVMCGFLWPASLIEHQVSEVHPYSIMYQYFIPSND